MFGTELHIWQDSFSHEKCIDIPLLHKWYEVIGQDPDKYRPGSPRDQAMEKTTKYWLVSLHRRYHSKR